MIAEQYTGKLRKETLPSGEIVIKSPTLTIQSTYLCMLPLHTSSSDVSDQFVGFYAGINFGSCGAISASFLARDHGYWAAYLVPTGIFCLVPFVLIAGRKNYIMTPPRGSVLLEVKLTTFSSLQHLTFPQTLRVIKFALGPRWSLNPIKTIRAIRAKDFWDPARPSKIHCASMTNLISSWFDRFISRRSCARKDHMGRRVRRGSVAGPQCLQCFPVFPLLLAL
jgi:POT family proton-dependent oligopeptide transporter